MADGDGEVRLMRSDGSLFPAYTPPPLYCEHCGRMECDFWHCPALRIGDMMDMDLSGPGEFNRAMAADLGDDPDGDQDQWYATPLQHILNDLVPEWVVYFRDKNLDYGEDGADELGLGGQYADLNRKMLKLKRALWDGQELKGEQPREILLDFIGHCFLTIDMIDRGVKPELRMDR